MSNLIVKTVSSDDGTLELGSNTSITQSLTANTITMGGTALSAAAGPFKNKIINGNFDIWQYGTSSTNNGEYAANKWKLFNSGTTKTASRQAFTLGQTDVPGEPEYYMRHVVTSSAGASNYCVMDQYIETVRTLAGKTATVSFYAKADASKNIVLGIYQYFGTGGSPSTSVQVSETAFALTSSWQKFTLTVSVPNISGKTLGSNNDDCLYFSFWFDAGSSFSGPNGLLGGQQSGTFDIAQVQLEEGPVATAFEQRSLAQELALCGTYLGPDGTTAGSVYMGGYKNKIINGNFDIWQRATSQTSSGLGSADRWISSHSGTTKTASRQAFTVGQTDVPGEPKYYMRHVVTSSAGASNYSNLTQNIESVCTLAGKTVTLSFYAKADASKNIAVDYEQYFGTGGSPSATVGAINAKKFALTSSWQKFTSTFTMPSISGKTLGSDNNDFFSITFWFDAGSTWDGRTDSLGQQSGTFDIAQVQLEEGPVATAFESRHIGQELALCKRYYQYVHGTGIVGSSTTVNMPLTFNPEMRAIPTLSILGTLTITEFGVGDKTVSGLGTNYHSSRFHFFLDLTSSGITIGNWATIKSTTGLVADAEL